MARTSQTQIQTFSQSPDRIAANLKRLALRVAEVEQFDPAGLTNYNDASSNTIRLSKSIEGTLQQVFGLNSPEYDRFRSAAHFAWPLYVGQQAELHRIRESLVYCRTNSLTTLKLASNFLEEELACSAVNPNEPRRTAGKLDEKSVFVVHGRDERSTLEVVNFLKQLELNPIVLHEKPNGGRHLLTKFREEAAKVSFAIVLLTPDDQGGLLGEEPHQRCRQNVVFELGFFLGVLGPERVVPLVKGDVEKPSDYDGIAYVPLDPNGGWQTKLARELKAAKVPFDLGKLL